MSDELKAMTALAGRFIALATKDAALLSELRNLADAFLASTAAPTAFEGDRTGDLVEHASNSPSESEPGSVVIDEGVGIVPVVSWPVPADPLVPAQPLPRLTLGSVRPPDSEARPDQASASLRMASTESTEDDLADIEARCRLKTEGARRAMDRLRPINSGAEFRD